MNNVQQRADQGFLPNRSGNRNPGAPFCVLVLGAKLQGMEAIYLAKKAGYRVIAADKNPNAPGRDLADEFYQIDLMKEEQIVPVIQQSDVIFPALEDLQVLKRLQQYSTMYQVPVVLDMNAYEISSSKERSNQLFLQEGIPMPKKYPDCEFPIILKPDDRSGSAQVEKADSRQEMESYLRRHKKEKTVMQEYLDGPSYSLEVIGDGKKFVCLQITEIVTDKDYDCMRIIAPAIISEDQKKQFYEMGEKLARQLNIKGIFDMEVIAHHGQLKILEIDARLPSQTPISVYHSTGVNMVQMLVENAVAQSPIDDSCLRSISEQTGERCCLYQQVQMKDGQLQMLGEHIMSETSHLRLMQNFFGADEAITDYQEGRPDWKAIVIITGNSLQEAENTYEGFQQRALKQAVSCRSRKHLREISAAGIEERRQTKRL